MADVQQPYGCEPTEVEIQAVRPKVGATREGKPFDHFVQARIASGEWRPEWVRAEVLGLTRPLEILRATRKGDFVKPWDRSDDADSYCPAYWADLAIA